MKKKVISGIVEFGEIQGSTEVPYGLLAEGGITEEYTTEVTKHRSAQGGLPVAVDVEMTDFAATGALLTAELVNYVRTMGLPSASLVGDLGAETPTDEVLSIISSEVGSQGPKSYYYRSKGIGAGQRLVVIQNAVISITGSSQANRATAKTLSFRIEALQNSAGVADVKITDAAA